MGLWPTPHRQPHRQPHLDARTRKLKDVDNRQAQIRQAPRCDPRRINRQRDGWRSAGSGQGWVRADRAGYCVVRCGLISFWRVKYEAAGCTQRICE